MASEFQRGLAQGRKEGRLQARQDILDYLEKRYMSDNVERETPQAKAILQLAHEVAEVVKV